MSLWLKKSKLWEGKDLTKVEKVKFELSSKGRIILLLCISIITLFISGSTEPSSEVIRNNLKWCILSWSELFWSWICRVGKEFNLWIFLGLFPSCLVYEEVVRAIAKAGLIVERSSPQWPHENKFQNGVFKILPASKAHR